MYSTTQILCGVIFAIVAIYESSAADTNNCKSAMSDMTKRQLNGISKCMKTMSFKNGKDKAAKMTCILKCVMSQEGILSPEGRMEKETFMAFLDKEVPENMKERAKEVLGKCQENHASNLDPNEEYCKSYDPLIKCFMASILQLCPV